MLVVLIRRRVLEQVRLPLLRAASGAAAALADGMARLLAVDTPTLLVVAVAVWV